MQDIIIALFALLENQTTFKLFHRLKDTPSGVYAYGHFQGHVDDLDTR